MEKYVALFPGQGTQFVGMYRELIDRFKIAKDTMREAESITNINLMNISQNGPIRQLASQEIAHVTIVAFSVAAFRTYISLGMPKPAACIGHSLGEYSALVCAGGLSFKDALNIVQLRCKLGSEIRKETGSSMSVLDNVDVANVETLLKEYQIRNKEVYLACINSNKQITLSGKNKDLADFEQELHRNNSCNITPLFNSAPYHSPLMRSKEKEFDELLNQISFSELRYPVISNITGHPYENMKISKRYLKEHLCSTINWVDSIEYVRHRNITTAVDFSANNFFRNLLGTDANLDIYSFNGNDTVEKLKNRIVKDKGGLAEKMAELVLVQPALSNTHWEEYIKGYLELRRLSEEKDMSFEHLFELLKSCLEAKGISKKEQSMIINQFLDENGLTYFQVKN